MTVSGRHFGDDTRVFVNGRRTAGTLKLSDGEKVTITLDTLPSEGLHLVQVQVPDGQFSNEFLFHITKDEKTADELQRELIRQSITPRNGIDAALTGGEVAAVKKVIRDKATANRRLSDRATPLSTAAISGHLEVVKYPLDTGADVNGANADGYTPLHVATFLCREEVVKLLLEKGANTAKKNNNGETQKRKN